MLVYLSSPLPWLTRLTSNTLAFAVSMSDYEWWREDASVYIYTYVQNFMQHVDRPTLWSMSVSTDVLQNEAWAGLQNYLHPEYNSIHCLCCFWTFREGKSIRAGDRTRDLWIMRPMRYLCATLKPYKANTMRLCQNRSKHGYCLPSLWLGRILWSFCLGQWPQNDTDLQLLRTIRERYRWSRNNYVLEWPWICVQPSLLMRLAIAGFQVRLIISAS